MELAPGDRVDRYILGVRLGEGGQGEVWRAADPIEPEHPKALKLVEVASATPNQLERLRREARRLVQLKHPSLIACHALFEDLHRDLLGVVMEYAHGHSLDDAMADARLTEDKRMLVLAHVAGALAYVHQRNVVHRDIKLENVVVTHAFWDAPQDPRTVKLIDFGIAVESDNPQPLTKLGCVIGTPPYLAPELIDPSGWNSVGGATPTSDVFAFGVLAWKLLVGPSAHPSGLPARSNLGEYAVAYRASAGGPWPPEAPQASWVPVIARCLALDPRHRVRDGLALVAELARAMPGVVLPTAEQAAPTPVAGEKRPATAPPTVYLGDAGPHTETAPAPVPLREPTPQPSARTVPQAPDLARWSPRPQYTSEPVVQPMPQPVPQYAPQYVAPKRKKKGVWVLGALFVLGSGAAMLAAGAAWYEGWLPALGESNAQQAASPAHTSSGPATAKAATTPPQQQPSAPARPHYYVPHNHPLPNGDICACCPSGHDCLGSPCGSPLRMDEWFLLRVGGADIGGKPLNPGLRICLERIGEPETEVCADPSNLGIGSLQPARLPVQWRDVAARGINVVIRDADGNALASDAFIRSDIKARGVTCLGFRVGPITGPTLRVDHVSIFVDGFNSVVPPICPPPHCK